MAGCSGPATSTANLQVAAAPPPHDDGKAAEGGSGGSSHAAALEQLKVGVAEGRVDKQASVRVPLPDAPHWMRVKFWGVPSLVGFRYGKEHHAIVAAFVTHVDDNAASGACAKGFEAYATPWIDAFEVDLTHDAPSAFMWRAKQGRGAPQEAPALVDVDTIFAKTATLAQHESYAAAYAAYPAWKGACLIVGVAVPSRDDEPRARAVRDRFAKEILPRVEVLTAEEPKERY